MLIDGSGTLHRASSSGRQELDEALAQSIAPKDSGYFGVNALRPIDRMGEADGSISPPAGVASAVVT
jgi:hypothetical protein